MACYPLSNSKRVGEGLKQPAAVVPAVPYSYSSSRGEPHSSVPVDPPTPSGRRWCWIVLSFLLYLCLCSIPSMGVSAKPHGSHMNTECHCAVDDRLEPARSKMKVLKKIKKRIGLSPRSSNSGVNNLPPLQFHPVHGDNVRLSQDGTIARRVESFCRGVTFTCRPIKIQEKICVKFQDISNNWSGVLRFGFSSTDPLSLRYNLPKYACPDLTNKPGYWAKALAERFAERNTVLFYYVTAAGDVHFGINGEEKGIFFSGVDTRTPLWGLFDIYGNSTGLEFISPRTHLNNFRAGSSIDAVVPALQSLSLHSHSDDMPAVSRYYPSNSMLPLPFHKTRGQNARLSNDRCVASRSDSEFCHGYVFTSRPLRVQEKLVIQIIATESMYMGALAFGLTSCDPGTLSPSQLPEDADALLDRREYWVVNKDIASSPQRGDELAFCVSSSGEVTVSKNGGPNVVFMHVDHTLQLWAFFDVYGSTQKIRCIGVEQPARPSRPSPPPVNSSRHCCRPTSAAPSPVPLSQPSSSDIVQLQPTLGGGTVLVVNLPPPHSNYMNQSSSRSNQIQYAAPSSHQRNSPQVPHDTDNRSSILNSYGNTYVEPVSAGGCSTLTPWMETAAAGTATGSECSVCYERAIDSVLYMCGHMCMCYECAVQQWRGKGGGHCPLCRAVIRDVIRTYKS